MPVKLTGDLKVCLLAAVVHDESRIVVQKLIGIIAAFKHLFRRLPILLGGSLGKSDQPNCCQ